MEKLAKPGTASIDKAKTQELGDIVDKAMKDLSDDFNTAKAIANLFELSTKINTYYQQPSELAVIDPEVFEQVIERFKGIIFDVLGLRNEAEAAQDGKTLDSVMQVLIELRKQAKFSKNYALSDKIRDDLKAAGIQLKDEKGGEMSYTIN